MYVLSRQGHVRQRSYEQLNWLSYSNYSYVPLQETYRGGASTTVVEKYCSNPELGFVISWMRRVEKKLCLTRDHFYC